MIEANVLLIAMAVGLGDPCSDDIAIDAWSVAVHPNVYAGAEGVLVAGSSFASVGVVELVDDEASSIWTSEPFPWPLRQLLPRVAAVDDKVVVLWAVEGSSDVPDEEGMYRAVIDRASNDTSTAKILSGHAGAWGLVVSEDVLIAAVSHGDESEQRLGISRSFDGGMSWEDPVPVDSLSVVRVNGFVENRAGAIYCLFKLRWDLSYILYRSLDRGVSWQHLRTFEQYNKATVACDRGTVVVAVSRRTRFVTYFASHDHGETWQEPVEVRPEGFYDYIYPEMTIDEYGTWHLIGITDTRVDNLLARGNLVYLQSEDAGKTWSHPDTLNCVNRAAQLYYEWSDYRMATWRGDLFVAYLNNEGNQLGAKVAVRRRSHEGQPAAPVPRVALLANPVPVNGVVTLRAHLATAGRLRSVVSAIDGRRVHAWTTDAEGPGEVQLKWDGCHTGGERAGAGVYFWRVSGEGVDETVQVVRY